MDFDKGNTKCKIICISKLYTYEVGGMILVVMMDLLLELKAYKTKFRGYCSYATRSLSK